MSKWRITNNIITILLLLITFSLTDNSQENFIKLSTTYAKEKTYDTVEEMQADFSLDPGDTANTRGFYNKDDGCGENYEIQDDTGGREVDGDKLLRLKNGNFASRSSGVQKFDGFMGVFFNYNGDEPADFYYSEDGIKMKFILHPGNSGRDPSIQYYKHMFYLCYVEPADKGTFRIEKSRDLRKWETKSYGFDIIERQKEIPALWAPDLFIDNDGKAYVYFAKERAKHPSQPSQVLMDMYVSSCSNIEEGTFGKAKKITLPDPSRSYIDGTVRKVGDKYYMVVKNETFYTDNENKSPMLLSSSTPTGPFFEIKEWPLSAIRGYEGFSLMVNGDTVYIYGDNFSERFDLAPKSDITVWKTNISNIETGPYVAEYIESPKRLRHGTIIPVTDNFFKRILNKINIQEKQKMLSDRVPRMVNFSEFKSETNDDITVIECFAPGKNAIYIVPKKKKIVIKKIVNAYGVTEFKYRFDDPKSSSLEIEGKKIKGDKKVQSMKLE